MVVQIIKHEWRNLTADRTLWWVTFILVVAIGYGVYNGTSWIAFLEESIENALQEEHDRLAKYQLIVANDLPPERRSRSPYSARYMGRNFGVRYAYLPPTPLASLSIGQSDLYASYFKVSTRSTTRQKRHSEHENPNHLLERPFDLAFVTVYLFPLLILALSYNLISSEREQGTMAMVLSQPVSLRKFVVAKVGFRAFITTVLVVGLSFLAFLLNGVNLLDASASKQLLMWIGIVVLYSAFWFSLAMAVNALGQNSATNAIILAGMWLAFVVLVPSAVSLLVRTLYPVSTQVEFIVARREATVDDRDREAQTLSMYFEDHPEFVPEGQEPDFERFDTLQYAAEMEVEQTMRPLLDQYREQLLRQQAQVNRLRFLSPAIVTQEALTEIAGTGLARYNHFLSVAETFHKEWRAYFEPKIFAFYKLTGKDYDEFPRYSYVEEPEGRVVDYVFNSLVGLIVPTLAIFAIGLLKLRRYPLSG